MRAIAIFNNKGGVGKTTLLCNLASFLALRKGRSVLVVDADPQCNASQSMFDDQTLYKIYTSKAFTLLTVVKPLSLGKGFADELTPRRSPRFGVDVLLGDPGMALTEDLLSSDWIQATGGDVRGLRTTFLFAHLLEKCESYDYVFFDMGPTLGAINRSVLIAADHFIVPMSIDIFSLRALDNISTQMATWKRRLEKGLDEVTDRSLLEIRDPTWHLRFGGYVTQQYKAKTTRGERRAVDAYDNIMKQIPGRVQKRLLDDLGAAGTASEYLLGSIPLLHSLVPMAQTARCPIFDLKSADGVRGAHFARVQDFEALMGGLASKFESQMVPRR